MTAERKMRTISVPGIPSAEMPLIEIASARPGPVVNVVGGLAGTAYAGIGACRALAARLPRLLAKGRVRLVPVVDVEGFFQRAARFCPLDGRALVGAFTAASTAPASSATDRIAQAVSEALADADVHIDVRGGEHTELHAHWVAVPSRAAQSEALAMEMAAASGADVRVAVNRDDPSSIELGAAGRMADQGRASLILSGGGGVSDVAADAEVLVADLLRVLDALGVVEGVTPERAVPLRVVGPRIWSHLADSSGLWVPATTPGAQVKAGEALGQIWDYFGDPIEDVTAPFDGCVLAITTSMAVNAEAGPEGDPWFARTVVVAEEGHGDGHACDLGAARTAAWQALDRRLDEHVASLQQFVRIPSARGEELAAQQWMARRMRELGLDVELIECDPNALARYANWSPTNWSYQGRPNVAGRWRGTGGGRSLILNAHVDTTSPEPVELWSRDPWGGEIDGNRLYARGAQDDKAGCCEMLFVVQALQEAGIRLRGDLILETTIDEECSGNGSLALVAAGYEADGVLMLDGTGLGRAIVAHPGHVAFRITIHGKPVPYISATHGVNAIEKAWVLIRALHELEARKNSNVPARWAHTEHPIHFNVYGISGGEWVGTVAARCVLDATLGFFPPQSVADARAEIETAVAEAAAQDEWLRDHPPQVTFEGLAMEPLEMGDDNPVVANLAEAHQAATGRPLEPVAITGFCDLHQHSLRRPTPGCLFGPGGGGGAHSVDEFFDLNDLAPVTRTALAFVLNWCGWEAA